MMKRTTAVGFVFMSVCGAVASASAEESSRRLELDKLKPNTFVEISQEQKPRMAFSSAWHMDSTGEFLMWGKIGGHRYESRRYEVQTLSFTETAPTWRESFPKGKEESWSRGQFPNWGCGCHPLEYEPDRPWLQNVYDRWVSNYGRVNDVRFVTTEGVLRPTRGYTYHQGAYDSRRDRLIYFVGGKTFAYDPRARVWTDLKADPPIGCDALAWASMAYDAKGDQLVLFGGAYGLTPWGGARTWLYDCERNRWTKATVQDGVEPPLRCCAELVYDPAHQVMVLFGGDALDKFMADTWVLDLEKLAWRNKGPAQSPPPVDHCAACYLPGPERILLVTPSRRHSNGRYRQGRVWTYDVDQNEWSPLPGLLPEKRMSWISCDYSHEHNAVLVMSPECGTWVYRPDVDAEFDLKRKMVDPGTCKRHPRGASVVESLKTAPEPDRKQREEYLDNLPTNTVVEVDYPGYMISKTWSTATIDTDRGVVLYVGGGHSGYKGTDYALYDVGTNRWNLDHPPCFIPFFDNYNASLFGWDYYMRPTSQHTYRWYCYDPASQLMVCCPRPAGPKDGFTVLLEQDRSEAFVYDETKHGHWTFLYHPASNTRYPPVFGRPFNNSWSMALCGTPKGVFAKQGRRLYHGQATRDVETANIEWTVLDESGPSGDGEYQPLIYDSKRNRLIFVAQKEGQPVQMWEHPLGKGSWEEIEQKRTTSLMAREIVYDRRHDCLVSIPEQKCLIMDFETKMWRELDVKMPGGGSLYGHECAMVYDPVHQVCIMLIPTRFSGELGLYLLRYDPETATYTELVER
ncbi:MAG: kelch repeat-containing protein [Pirellulaceae bacterium]